LREKGDLDLGEPDIDALGIHQRGQLADCRDRAAGGGEMTASLDGGGAAKAMTQRIAVALGRARAFSVASIMSA